MTETKEELKFLNIRIGPISGGYSLSQKEYVDKALKKYGLEDSNPARSPLDTQQDLDDFRESTCLDSMQYQEMLELFAPRSKGILFSSRWWA
ncbi:hypothetical protein KPH14_000895 [Odynerus spinipes]|uniref:Uncharacterized protein n=1 Tax=Odynerus spinipes TaxID=1348599 RepID=A0AAD9RCD1_9HYME|nr:hypothetical protein KPH14_000895 [Odynerus spinipes]